MPEGARFCPNCGAAVEHKVSQPEAQAADGTKVSPQPQSWNTANDKNTAAARQDGRAAALFYAADALRGRSAETIPKFV